jgi:uncharacterized protein YecE (DUF72 family)
MGVYVGCAGWQLRREHAELFPPAGSHLQRYAGRFNAVEINSSFYRPHRPATYARWADSVPSEFRFSVKLPKTITHAARLCGADAELDRFLAEATQLGERLGCVLVQLPPSLALDPAVAERFFTALRARHDGPVAFEPRHPTWFGGEAEALLREMAIARVAADPPRHPYDGQPAGDLGMVYYRLHGSPRIYYSAYPPDYLDALAGALAEHEARGHAAWCIFDNTALGAATTDALGLIARLSAQERRM